MGSLVSTPKVPKPQSQPQVVTRTVSQPTATQQVDPQTQISEPTQAVTQSEQRTQSILSRSRGRLGTIATGLQGFLRDAGRGDERKTLLGE